MTSSAKPVMGVVMGEGPTGSNVPAKKVPEKTADDPPERAPSKARGEPIYLRHRFHGELGQLLRDYYTEVLDRPLPDHLLRLIDQFRLKERS